jgi:hypothetical protein
LLLSACYNGNGKGNKQIDKISASTLPLLSQEIDADAVERKWRSEIQLAFGVVMYEACRLQMANGTSQKTKSLMPRLPRVRFSSSSFFILLERKTKPNHDFVYFCLLLLVFVSVCVF